MSKEQQTGGIVKAWEATIKRSQAAAKKRTASIFGTLPVSPSPDQLGDISPGPGEVYIAEKLLSNGDYYTGHWVDNLPNGHGKYLWLDGCMYEGEWFRGIERKKSYTLVICCILFFCHYNIMRDNKLQVRQWAKGSSAGHQARLTKENSRVDTWMEKGHTLVPQETLTEDHGL